PRPNLASTVPRYVPTYRSPAPYPNPRVSGLPENIRNGAGYINYFGSRVMGDLIKNGRPPATTLKPISTCQQNTDVLDWRTVDTRFAPARLERFKESIFYRIVLQFLPYKICPASFSQASTWIELTLNDKDIQFLTSVRGDKLEPGIKLFCVPVKEMEALKDDDNERVCVKFPETCELRINGKPMQISLRGKKNQPGTTRPPDIHPHIVKAKSATNRVELVYLKTNEAYLLVAQAVLINPVAQIVEKIVATKSVPAETIREKLFSGGDEEDLVATVELSLKCPLGFSRINHPFRSIHCTHAQCFDGFTYLQMNEQMETWTCPVCQIKIDPSNDLIRDEFFLGILESTSDEVESVLMEADGSWCIKSAQSELVKRLNSPNLKVIELSDSPPCSNREQTPDNVIDLTLSDDELPSNPIKAPNAPLVCGSIKPSAVQPIPIIPTPFLTNSLPSCNPPAAHSDSTPLLPPPYYGSHTRMPSEELVAPPLPSFMNRYGGFPQNSI
ncbi:E3 SUMO-protein ligase pli1, partial [Massospora cicadina]